MEPESLAELMALDEEALLEQIGQELSVGTFGANFSRQKFIRVARNWLELNQQRLTQVVCGSTELRQLCQSETVSTTIDVIGLALVLVETIEKSGAATLIACLLVKQGIANYCRVYWADESEKKR